MMRLATTLGLICLSFLAFGLYQGAIVTRQNEEALRNLDKQIASESEAIRILKAEWSFLNQPERLQALAKKRRTGGGGFLRTNSDSRSTRVRQSWEKQERPC